MTFIDIPLMDKERLDYINGSYDAMVSVLKDSNSAEIRHIVHGNNLVKNMIAQSEATYAVEVASPYSTYRRVHILDEFNGAETVCQTVTWEEADIVPPIYFRPMILAMIEETISRRISTKIDGVHELWDDVEIEIHPASILASGPFYVPSGMVDPSNSPYSPNPAIGMGFAHWLSQ